MSSWETELRAKLKRLRLSDDVIAELMNHFEDLYDDCRTQGMSEDEAIEHCLQEASELQRASRKIRSAKRKGIAMNDRVKGFWLPGLVAFTSASILLMILQRVAFSLPMVSGRVSFLQPILVWRHGVALALYLPWLITLPLCGAAGAYMSRRGGGQRLTCLAAGLFPALVMSAAMLSLLCVSLPISFLVEHNRHLTQPLYGFLLMVCNWTLLPGLALLLGAAPVCALKTR